MTSVSARISQTFWAIGNMQPRTTWSFAAGKFLRMLQNKDHTGTGGVEDPQKKWHVQFQHKKTNKSKNTMQTPKKIKLKKFRCPHKNLYITIHSHAPKNWGI